MNLEYAEKIRKKDWKHTGIYAAAIGLVAYALNELAGNLVGYDASMVKDFIFPAATGAVTVARHPREIAPVAVAIGLGTWAGLELIDGNPHLFDNAWDVVRPLALTLEGVVLGKIGKNIINI